MKKVLFMVALIAFISISCTGNSSLEGEYKMTKDSVVKMLKEAGEEIDANDPALAGVAMMFDSVGITITKDEIVFADGSGSSQKLSYKKEGNKLVNEEYGEVYVDGDFLVFKGKKNDGLGLPAALYFEKAKK